MKKKLRYVCCQPATLYYAWQVEVMINNFIEMGIEPPQINIVSSIDNVIPQNWLKLKNHYTEVNFFFYKDTRTDKSYISSIRPNILKQYFQEHPNLSDDSIFYHDCDIIFTKPPSEWITEEMIQDDNWYGSDVRWYISHKYITSKGEDVLNKMCEIIEISPNLVEENELNCIGAQYLMKGVDKDFWEWVEVKSNKLFKEITQLNRMKKKEIPNYHELQIWCSDMWCVLWKAWLMGKKTITHTNFDFSWGTSKKPEYDRMNIMHNAGVTTSKNALFYKAEYMNKLPYDSAEPKKETASWEYWNWIQKTAVKSVLI